MPFQERLAHELSGKWLENAVSYAAMKKILDDRSSTHETVVEALRKEVEKVDSHYAAEYRVLSASFRQILDCSEDSGVASDQECEVERGEESTEHYAAEELEEVHSDAEGDTAPRWPPGAGPELVRRSLCEIITRQFLILVGDWRIVRRLRHRRKDSEQSYVDWFMHSRRLQLYADLNREALERLHERLMRHRPELVAASADVSELLGGVFARKHEGRLARMTKVVKMQFAAEFNQNLQQYAEGCTTVSVPWDAKWQWVAVATALFACVLFAPIFEDQPAARKCLALFGLIIVLWVSEAFPFFCTAMLIPVVAVPLGIITDPASGVAASSGVAARIMMGRMFDHVQVLVLGALTMARAIGKTHVEFVAARLLFRVTSSNPELYMLGVMVLGCLLCSLVSSVAAPLLVLGVVQPTLWRIPRESGAPQAILLGLAFGCNVGSMLSPVSSPQNAVAIQLDVLRSMPFVHWVSIASPLVAFSLLTTWVVLLAVWRPFGPGKCQRIPYEAFSGNFVWGKDTFLVVAVCAATVTLWCLPPEFFFGDVGVIGLIPVIVFFGVGILKKDDFNSLSWHLLFLLAGGNMLGLVARDSQLLERIVQPLAEAASSHPSYLVMVVVLLVMAIASSFVSHIVSAIVLLPIISRVGASLAPDGAVSQTTLVLAAVFMCSGSMAFPISSFPNVNSLLAEDSKGVPYLRAKHYLFPGFIATFVSFFGLVTFMVPLMWYLKL